MNGSASIEWPLLAIGLVGLLASIGIPTILLWKLRKAAKALADGRELPGGGP